MCCIIVTILWWYYDYTIGPFHWFICSTIHWFSTVVILDPLMRTFPVVGTFFIYETNSVIVTTGSGIVYLCTATFPVLCISIPSLILWAFSICLPPIYLHCVIQWFMWYLKLFIVYSKHLPGLVILVTTKVTWCLLLLHSLLRRYCRRRWSGVSRDIDGRGSLKPPWPYCLTSYLLCVVAWRVFSSIFKYLYYCCWYCYSWPYRDILLLGIDR